MKLKLWGFVMIGTMVGSLFAAGLAHAETQYTADAPHAYRALQTVPTATTTITCASERALQDTLYWAVQVYDQCVAIENANCVVPDFPGYLHPSRDRMVQLRNQAKSDLSACMDSE